MLYLVIGTRKRNGSSEIFCLHDSDFNFNHYFREENDLVSYLADNHCSELNEILNLIPHEVQKEIEKKKEFSIKRMLENDEIMFIKTKIKNLVY